MINGVDQIVTKMTSGDEFGVYRRYRQSIDVVQEFLLFTCTDREETIRTGGQIANVLNASLRNELPPPTKEEEEAKSDDSKPAHPVHTGKPRRVSGVGPKIRGMVRDGATDEEIETQLLDLYLAAGHTADSGRLLLVPYIKEIRKKG